MSVHVAVSDPLPLYRRGIMTMLRDAGFDSEAPDDLLSWIEDNRRKIILLTLQSPEDWAMLAELCRNRTELSIIAAVPDLNVSAYVRALTEGAVGVVPRDASPAVIQDAFDAALHHKCVLPIEVLREMMAPDSGTGATEYAPSSRELDWLRNLAEGLTIAQLAGRAGYSERMMFRLLRDMYDRLGVRNRTDALLRAKDLGWL